MDFEVVLHVPVEGMQKGLATTATFLSLLTESIIPQNNHSLVSATPISHMSFGTRIAPSSERWLLRFSHLSVTNSS